MKTSGNILFTGVGGQGILTASEIVAYAFLFSDFDVKKSEVHGLAQRGGAVSAELRYGEKVYSPLIEPGQVDLLMAFETIEAVRYLPMLRPGSHAIVSTQKIFPPSVANGKIIYPDNSNDILKENGIDVIAVDAFSLAKKAGEIKAVSAVMVGALSGFLPIEQTVFETVLASKMRERVLAVNLKAFSLGKKAAKGGV